MKELTIYVDGKSHLQSLRLNKAISLELSKGRTLKGTLSNSQIDKLILQGVIQVNKKTQKKTYKLKEGDVISVEITFTSYFKENNLKTMPALDILYEDEYFLLVNKPSNLTVHNCLKDEKESIPYFEELTLSCILEFYYPELKKIKRSGIVNRLDKDTTGVICIAKSLDAVLRLRDLFQKRHIQRKYVAVVHGIPSRKAGIIRTFIKKNPRMRKVSISLNKLDKEAITSYRVLKSSAINESNDQHSTERKDYYSLIECVLSTGRTHQIRVHMQYIGHPIVGEKKYNRNRSDLLSRQALHSYSTEFIHPYKNEVLKVKAPLPEDIRILIQNLELHA